MCLLGLPWVGAGWCCYYPKSYSRFELIVMGNQLIPSEPQVVSTIWSWDGNLQVIKVGVGSVA